MNSAGYITHHALLASMDSNSVSLEAQRAIENLRRDSLALPEIQSDNGSAFISTEFRIVLKENGLTHKKIHPPLCSKLFFQQFLLSRNSLENLKARTLRICQFVSIQTLVLWICTDFSCSLVVVIAVWDKYLVELGCGSSHYTSLSIFHVCFLP